MALPATITVPKAVQSTAAVTRKEQQAIAKPPKSPFDEARELIQSCKAWREGFGRPPFRMEDLERPRAFKMSASNWSKLAGELGETRDRYPRFSYNTATSILIIQYMPSPMHESIAPLLADAFNTWKRTLPRDQQYGLSIKHSEKRVAYAGRWAGSEKEPDLGFYIKQNGRQRLKWVLEVGFSESRTQMEDDARLWLEGMPHDVEMVIFVNFMEDPPYRCPLTAHQDPRRREIPLDYGAILDGDFIPEGRLGPVTYKGLTWVGHISKATMEVWARDGDEKAKQQGPAKDLLDEDEATIEIYPERFLSSPYHGTIVVDLEEFRSMLPDEVTNLARVRCQLAVKQYNKRMGDDAADEDYEE